MSEKKQKKGTDKDSVKVSVQKSGSGLQRIICDILPPAAVIITIAALVFYTLFFLNHLMHSDMAAEVLLSKLLRDEGRLITDSWYYSTEIRILYSQLVMTPLFYVFSDFHTVKVISIFIFLIFLILAFHFLAKRFGFSRTAYFLALLLLLSPWSNEYLDMMFLGDFYTSQTICMYVFVSFIIAGIAGKTEVKAQDKKKKGIRIAGYVFFAVFSVLLGLSGMRYLACLFAPLFLAFLLELADKKADGSRVTGIKDVSKDPVFFKLAQISGYTLCALFGYLIHRFYLSTHYSFDNTSAVSFVPLSDVPGRVSKALYQMIEFFGYRDGVGAVSLLGISNAIKFMFFIAFICVIVSLFGKRKDLEQNERVFLYFFIFLFLINLYMLIFTDVLMQYRYWIPVFIIGVLLVGIYVKRTDGLPQCKVLILFFCLSSLLCLYSELWQDVKFDDCAKRQGYMAFLEKEGYEFGYATFWNGPVTEYLSNGRIHVGDFTADDAGDIVPYEWLTPKSYYKEGYHKGKTFLLLARTEEAGMLNGDFTVMEDAERVYEDEYYAVYEGSGMYLFSKD